MSTKTKTAAQTAIALREASNVIYLESFRARHSAPNSIVGPERSSISDESGIDESDPKFLSWLSAQRLAAKHARRPLPSYADVLRAYAKQTRVVP